MFVFGGKGKASIMSDTKSKKQPLFHTRIYVIRSSVGPIVNSIVRGATVSIVDM